MTESPPPLSPESGRALLAIANYRHFWLSRFLDNLAVQAQAVTIAWQVYAIARHSHSVGESAFLVGMIGLAQFLPLFALTLIAGDTADRHDRRLIMGVCIGVEVVGALVLCALSLAGSTLLWPIFLIAAGFGAARAFFAPASTAPG